MGKSTNFSGQPILNQLLVFMDKGKIGKISKSHGGDRYVKKFTTYNHVVVMPKGSIITFDKGYVDYAQYEARLEYDLPGALS